MCSTLTKAMKINNEGRTGTFIYSAAHFLTDFACAFFMFGVIYGCREWYIAVLLYNFFAFAVQMPVGVIADRLNRNRKTAASGFGLISASYLIYAVLNAVGCIRGFVLIPVCIIGLGNAIFHIGGGLGVLNACSVRDEKGVVHEKCSALGIFVAPGAIGIYFGTVLGKSASNTVTDMVYAVCITAAVAGIIVMLCLLRIPFREYDNAEFDIRPKGSRLVPVFIMCLFLVVCLRSYMGMIQSFEWKADYAVLSLAALAGGKALGGILADRLGIFRVSVFSLAGAAVLFLFADYPAAGIAAILLFQMTMPLTLKAASLYFPGMKGFAFGMLTLALFVGLLPSYFEAVLPIEGNAVYSAVSVASLVLLLAGLTGLIKKYGRRL